MHERLGTQRLVALFVAGWLAFNFPLQRLWAGDAVALFGAWAVLIGLLALLMERGAD